MEPWRLLHSALACPSSGNALHLKSTLISYPLLNNSSVYLTTKTEVGGMQTSWRALRDSVLSSLTHPPGMALPRTACSSAARMRPKRPWPPLKQTCLDFHWCFTSHQFSIVRRQTEGTIGRTSGDWSTLNKNSWLRNWQRGSSSIASAPALDVSAVVCTTGAWPLLRLVSVAQRITPSTMLSSNVQSIDLLMDCTAWRFWMMRQSVGCSTLHWDLVRPSSGLNELAQTMMIEQLVLAYCRHSNLNQPHCIAF